MAARPPSRPLLGCITLLAVTLLGPAAGATTGQTDGQTADGGLVITAAADPDRYADMTLDQLLAEVAATSDQLAVTDQALAEITGSLDAALPALADLQADADAAQARHTTLVGQLALAVQARDTAAVRLAAADAALLDAQHRLADVDADVATVRADAADHAQAVLAAGPAGHLDSLDALLGARTLTQAQTDWHLFGQALAYGTDLQATLAAARSDLVAATSEARRMRRSRSTAAAAADRSAAAVADLAVAAHQAAQQAATARATQQTVVAALQDRHAAVDADRQRLTDALTDLQQATQTVRSRYVDPASGTHCPVIGATFVDDWHFPRSGGRLHKGKDMFAPVGTPITSTHAGTVRAIDPVDRYTGGSSGDLGGITISVSVGPAEHWYYAHLDSVAASLAVGDDVDAGQVIGYVGNSGNARSTPPHLHIGHYVNGVAVNPHPDIDPACPQP